MSVAVYYEARRARSLSADEKKAIDKIMEKYSVDDLIRRYVENGEGFDWESFELRDALEPGVVLAGATKLPDNTEEAVWIGIQHWSNALGEIRRLLDDAAWRVSVEDHEIP